MCTTGFTCRLSIYCNAIGTNLSCSNKLYAIDRLAKCNGINTIRFSTSISFSTECFYPRLGILTFNTISVNGNGCHTIVLNFNCRRLVETSRITIISYVGSRTTLIINNGNAVFFPNLCRGSVLGTF